MISLVSVSKRYGRQQPAVDDLSLEVAEGELCVLLGPSGCGKTTTLRMVNRLIEPSSGTISVDGRDVTTMDPVALRRGIGYVMQQGGLFPHQRVADNVATVPRLLGWPKPRVAERVVELLGMVGLDPDRYGRRWPHELSGGERQRVGVARALGGNPPVLLMDEPFAAVDPVTRARLQEEFRELQMRLGKTVMFVTHDIDEAIALGSRIAVLSKGAHLEQYGSPAEVISSPASDFVAQFVGAESGLHRLSVTKVALEHLTKAPHFSTATSFREANEHLRRTGYRFGLVEDGTAGRGWDGAPIGWVDRVGEDAEVPDVPVSARLRPFSGEVRLNESLQEALAVMLRHDDGFVAVSDGMQIVGVLTPDDLHAAMRPSLGGSR